ncbi:MAG: dihydroxyacetone kinase subunit L [Paracoccaceae bacterium]|nr:MAG: dihydroxyacetone kinase subunit L [Paracoccaceae bacterium]
MRLLEGVTMAMTTASLQAGIAAVLAHLDDTHAMLTELDGQVGDGDLGITLIKAFRELNRIAPDLPPDLGQAFMVMAQGVAKVSSSSFGTLLATSLMTAAKATRGQTALDWAALPPILIAGREAMSARSKANLGDKTVLDALQSAAEAAEGTTEPGAMATAALSGIGTALDAFRDQPCKVGRARIFGDRTVGMDDPGMIALREMVNGLAAAT